MSSKKLFLSGIVLVSGLLFASYTFAGSGELRFDQSNVSVRLNCTHPTVNVIVSGDIYNSYTADIPFVNQLILVNPNQSSASAFGSKTINNGSCWSLSNCLRFVGSKDSGMLSGGNNGWTFTLQNSGYFRSTTISFTGYRQSTQSVVSSWSTNYTTTNGLLSLLNLDVSLYPAPCTWDTANPIFGFTWMTPHVTNYIYPQFNDRIYRFDLRDMSGINDYGFYTWYNGDPRDADWTVWSDYSTWPTVLNGSGINLATFVFEIGVETSVWSNTFTVNTFTGTLNYTWWDVITWSNNELLFYPYDFTWNRRNRNYTGSLTTGALWLASFSDADGYRSFGTEREVIITWYVYDRANPALKSNTFAVHFNYGANPWSSNIESSGLVTGCGPNGLSTIGVNTAPGADSGAYIQKYNSGFYLRPFKVFIHDDWAGVDSGTIVVTITGTQWGSPFTVNLTGTVSDSSNLWLTPFTRTGPISVATAGNGIQSVYSVTGSDRNYEVLVNYTGKWDSETQINVTVNYQDLVGRAWSGVSCNYVSTAVPFDNNRESDIHLLRTPFPMWGILSGFVIDLQDERAGVDSGTIVLTISWYEFTGGVLSPRIFTFTWSAGLGTWLAQYSITTGLDILDPQLYNYTITVPISTDYFSGYFVPERPILITIAYSDLRVPVPNSNASNTGININENALLRGFLNVTDEINTTAEWFDAFPISTYSATSGNTQFSGLQFSIFDHRAGVDGEYNFVKIVWDRRWVPATYLFSTSDSTGRNRADWTCVSDNCMTGDMSKIAELVSDYDSYTGQHPTIQQSTWYKFQITWHNIYFDYGYYASGGVLQPSLYDVTISWSDLRPDVPNYSTWSTWLFLDNLQCRFLERCSFDQLTLVWWDEIWADPDDTITQNPLTGTIDGFEVDKITSTRLNIVWSGIELDAVNHIVSCSAAEWLLDIPITLNFTGVTQLPPTPATTGYTDRELKIADGLFELTGVNNDILIVQ